MFELDEVTDYPDYLFLNITTKHAKYILYEQLNSTKKCNKVHLFRSITVNKQRTQFNVWSDQMNLKTYWI